DVGDLGAPCFPLTGSTVADLHRSDRPPTVTPLVIAVVVDAIDGQTGRRVEHVGVESFKVEAPVFADGDAAPAVIAVALGVRIEAALLHADPASVGGGHAAPASMAVLGVALCCCVSDQATTTPREALAQIAPEHEPFRTAVADAMPKSRDRAFVFAV